MTEADLVKIRTALEKETLSEACLEMDKVLLGLGYYRAEPFMVVGVGNDSNK